MNEEAYFQAKVVLTHGDEPEASCNTALVDATALPLDRGAISSFAVPHADAPEFDRLPEDVRTDARLVLKAIEIIYHARNKSAAARHQALCFRGRRGFSVDSLWRKLDAYLKSGGDWRAIMNSAKAGVAYWDNAEKADRVPDEFILKFWRPLVAANKRSGGCEAAYRKFLRIWETGHDDKGKAVVIPGYGTWQRWFTARNPGQPLPATAPLPKGLSYRNLMRHKQPRAQLVIAREGIASARVHTPHILGTRAGLRFLEEVLFDDVKMDFRVIDPATGQIMDLWLLVALDRATGMMLGYGLRPARSREDGTQEHLRLADMKQLAGWVLERWGLPPYPIKWKVENGTATFTDAVAAAIGDLFDRRIKVSFASMIGGKSPVGYGERGLGNSRAKATLEASFNLLHNENGDLPAQVGRRYDVRPADLQAREREALQIFGEIATKLPDHLRGQAKFPVLDILQARTQLNRVFDQMNTRTEHELEGFDFIWEWRPSPSANWEPLTTIPDVAPATHETRRRKESPLERMQALVKGLDWNRVSPLALTAFYDTTQRLVIVDDSGEIGFRVDGRDYTFRATDTESVLTPGTKLLAYHHPREINLLYLTRLAPHRGYVATWVRRVRVAAHDEAGLAEQFTYTKAAMAAHRAAAADTASGERAELDAMRAHNANLIANSSALDADIVATAPVVARPGVGEVNSATATALHRATRAVAATKVEVKRAEQEHADLLALGEASLLTNLRQQETYHGDNTETNRPF